MRGSRLHRWFGDRVLAKDLWLPTHQSLARAWLVGFPITVTPFLPLQSVFATIAALMVRGNLLLCIAMQFLSTPLTAPVHLPVCYFVGELVRGRGIAARPSSMIRCASSGVAAAAARASCGRC